MHKYQFNIGDVLRISSASSIEGISVPGGDGKEYKDNLRVTYRFWDGLRNVYVVSTGDGTEIILMEQDAELQQAAPGREERRDETYERIGMRAEDFGRQAERIRQVLADANGGEAPAPLGGDELYLKVGCYIDPALKARLVQLGIIPDEVRSRNVGASDYARHVVQPWAIWQEYGLNPWDADIVKRVLRHKATDPRRMDYEKIIHDCQERIRQIDTGGEAAE